MTLKEKAWHLYRVTIHILQLSQTEPVYSLGRRPSRAHGLWPAAIRSLKIPVTYFQFISTLNRSKASVIADIHVYVVFVIYH